MCGNTHWYWIKAWTYAIRQSMIYFSLTSNKLKEIADRDSWVPLLPVKHSSLFKQPNPKPCWTCFWYPTQGRADLIFRVRYVITGCDFWQPLALAMLCCTTLANLGQALFSLLPKWIQYVAGKTHVTNVTGGKLLRSLYGFFHGLGGLKLKNWENVT